MSKQSLLTLANFNLFKNSNAEIEFSKSKDERVQAQYSGYDKQKGYDVRGIKAKSGAGVGFIRLSISMLDSEGKREYHNGALFNNDKKTKDNQPDFQGTVNLDNKSDGPKLRLSAWKKKGEKAGDYLSVAIQDYQPRQDGDAGASRSDDGSDDFDLGNSKPAGNAGKGNATPAKSQGKAAAAKAPAYAEEDDSDDIPF